MSEPKVGEYWMHHMGGRGEGTPVRVSDQDDHGRLGISYVQIVGERESKPSVICGGHSGQWPASDFKPITNPYLLAATKVFEAREMARDLRVKASQAEADESKWQSVLEVLFEAANAQGKGASHGD